MNRLHPQFSAAFLRYPLLLFILSLSMHSLHAQDGPEPFFKHKNHLRFNLLAAGFIPAMDDSNIGGLVVGYERNVAPGFVFGADAIYRNGGSLDPIPWLSDGYYRSFRLDGSIALLFRAKIVGKESDANHPNTRPYVSFELGPQFLDVHPTGDGYWYAAEQQSYYKNWEGSAFGGRAAIVLGLDFAVGKRMIIGIMTGPAASFSVVKERMIENISPGSVPQEVWDNFYSEQHRSTSVRALHGRLGINLGFCF